MARAPVQNVDLDDEVDEQDVSEQIEPGSIAAVVSGTDWTTETIVSQLQRGNIQLNPRFQRRDAWKRDRKSRFIESLIVGLPIPQIVLAESKRDRGQFIILDGKQRLLSILQFWGLGEGENNAYALSGLTLRSDLMKRTFQDLSGNGAYALDFNALCNQSIRTVVIRNWKDTSFLHTVFLRLNTGSVTLSPQELRQALLPGPFSDFIDEAATASEGLRRLLGLSEPDPRMRDIEILARFLAFRFFAQEYPGRMKDFLDNTFGAFNSRWHHYKPLVVSACADFEKGVDGLLKIFGDTVARKPGSNQFNRAIFDALIFFQSQLGVRNALRGRAARIRHAYDQFFASDSAFLKAIESDTAGAPNTSARMKLWAERLSRISGVAITAPQIPTAAAGQPAERKKTKKPPKTASRR